MEIKKSVCCHRENMAAFFRSLTLFLCGISEEKAPEQPITYH